MSEPVLIGTSDSAEIHLDVGALVGSHLGIVANSGGGNAGMPPANVVDFSVKLEDRAIEAEEELLRTLAMTVTR